MKKFLLSAVVAVSIIFLSSCARGISPEQAANGKAKCGRNYVR